MQMISFHDDKLKKNFVVLSRLKTTCGGAAHKTGMLGTGKYVGKQKLKGGIWCLLFGILKLSQSCKQRIRR